MQTRRLLSLVAACGEELRGARPFQIPTKQTVNVKMPFKQGLESRAMSAVRALVLAGTTQVSFST